MTGKKRFAINVVMNWASMAVSMVVPFFLSPFVVRHLGAEVYGVWILAVSTVSYLNILDLGLRSAIVRFVSKGDAEGKTEQAQSIIGAALWFRLLVAAAISGLSLALMFFFPRFFKVPVDLQHAGQITVLLCALGVAGTLVSGVFGGVLAGIHRFDILSSITILQTVVRAGGVLFILDHGHGLIGLACWDFAVNLLTAVVTMSAALKLYPPCRIRLRRPEVDAFKLIWSYSFKTFIIIIAVQVVFYTDNIVVGAFLSVAAVTFYSIAGTLAMYSGQVSTSMGTTFIPMASNIHARDESERLKRLLIHGTQAALALMLPIGISLLIRGKTFIGLWMGPQYSEISGTVLQILLISQYFTIANSTAGQIAYGIDKHKSVATWAAIEAALNLALSLILVKTIGLYGVAWGTSIAQAIVHIIFWPRYVRKELGVPIKTFLWEGWAKIPVLSIPFAAASIYMDRHLHPTSLITFFGEILITLPVYVACVVWIFKSQLVNAWKSRRGVQHLSTPEVSS